MDAEGRKQVFQSCGRRRKKQEKDLKKSWCCFYLVERAAVGHQQQTKAARCTGRAGFFFPTNESKLIKEGEKSSSCTTSRGGNVTMGVCVFTVFSPSTLHLLTLARTFSNEAGLTSEKQMRKTSWREKTENKVRSWAQYFLVGNSKPLCV